MEIPVSEAPVLDAPVLDAGGDCKRMEGELVSLDFDNPEYWSSVLIPGINQVTSNKCWLELSDILSSSQGVEFCVYQCWLFKYVITGI